MLLQQIKMAGGVVEVIITDGNRVNQSFFRKFTCTYPWLTTDGIFLLFDFVHIIKCIRNNKLTEKCGEIRFFEDNKEYVAKWGHLIKLFDLEKNQLVKMSKLTEVSVNPKPIERQKVNVCLQVFSDETLNAFRVLKESFDECIDGTMIFLSKIIHF